MTGIYFSGTGNTRFCVEHFLDVAAPNSEAYSIEDKNAVNAIAKNDEIIFGYPIYYSCMPKIVSDFIIRNRELWKGKKIFVIATMALFSGDGSGVAARLFESCGAEITGGLHVKMPDCISDVSVLKRTYEKNCAIIESAKKKITVSAERYKSKKHTREGLGFLSRTAGFLVQRMWFKSKTKSYTDKLKIDSTKCTGCGKCVRLCPMKNIEISEGRVVPKDMCTMCYRCVNRCHEQAITLIGSRIIQQHSIEKYIKK